MALDALTGAVLATGSGDSKAKGQLVDRYIGSEDGVPGLSRLQYDSTRVLLAEFAIEVGLSNC